MTEVGGGRYLLFTVNHGWARSELHFKDLKKKTPVEPIVDDVEAHFQEKFHEGRLYVRTDLDAPNYRLLTIDLARPSREHWREIIAESDDVLQEFSFIDGKPTVRTLHNVDYRIRVFAPDRASFGEIPLPEPHRARIRAGAKGKGRLPLSSCTRLPVTFEVDLKTGERRLW